MKPQGSRRKGRRGENEAACLLAQWYYHDPTALMRTHASRTKRGFRDQVGDVAPARSELPQPWVFSVEVKNRKDWGLEDLLYPKSAVKQFWVQCKDAARASDKIPLLLLKKARRPWLAALRTVDFMAVVSFPVRMTYVRSLKEQLTFCSLTTLFAHTAPGSWIALWRSRYHAATSRRS